MCSRHVLEVDSRIPEHTLEENEKEIIIVIVAPLSKPKEVAFVLEKKVFTFESPPYLLKIKLPHSVSYSLSSQAYDDSTRTYKIKLKKTSELQEGGTDKVDEKIMNPVAPSEGESTHQDREKQFYGFANMYSNMFGQLYSEFSDVISLPDPDFLDIDSRRILREKEENEKWNDDHYLADTMETDHLESIFKYEPAWIVSPLNGNFRNDENEILLQLIDDSKLNTLSKENVVLSEFQIVDILYCYAYNIRTTEGDSTVESGWTINKLSSTLSWFEVFEDLETVLVSCYRRSLIFPLYRNWNLAEMVHKDVVNILKSGRKQITRCLLEVRDLFGESGYRDILNSLYINDLCNFAFHMADERCFALSEEVNKIHIKKYQVNAELPLLEIAAHLALEEETEGSNKTNSNIKNVLDKIAGLNLDCESDASSESDSEESDSVESSDDED